jgi:hypothetical protein
LNEPLPLSDRRIVILRDDANGVVVVAAAGEMVRVDDSKYGVPQLDRAVSTSVSRIGVVERSKSENFTGVEPWYRDPVIRLSDMLGNGY